MKHIHQRNLQRIKIDSLNKGYEIYFDIDLRLVDLEELRINLLLYKGQI